MLESKKFISKLSLICGLFALEQSLAMDTSRWPINQAPTQKSDDIKIFTRKNVSELSNIVHPGDWVFLDIDETILRTGKERYAPDTILLNLDPKVVQMISNWRVTYPVLFLF